MARKKVAASPPPTERDDWLREMDEELTFGKAVGYEGTLESHGLDSLDATELCLWLEDRYGIEYKGEKMKGFMKKTLREIRCEAEALVRRKSAR